MRIAFLGLGQMGLAIAKRLVEKGHTVTVWNRTSASAKPLVDLGAKLAGVAAQAVQSAEVVFTMLLDDKALEDVLYTQQTLDAIPVDAIHVSLSTISVAFAERLESEHASRHQRFVSVPVFGRPNVAAEGKLWLAIAGPQDAVGEAMPLLESISRGHTVVGARPSQANAVKLAGNFLITSMVASFSEAITVAEAHAIDPALFVETINSALFQSAFVGNYGKIMVAPSETPGATLNLGAKDTRLFREAARSSHIPTPLADIYQDHIDTAVSAGRGDEDWAAGYLHQTRIEAKK